MSSARSGVRGRDHRPGRRSTGRSGRLRLIALREDRDCVFDQRLSPPENLVRRRALLVSLETATDPDGSPKGCQDHGQRLELLHEVMVFRKREAQCPTHAGDPLLVFGRRCVGCGQPGRNLLVRLLKSGACLRLLRLTHVVAS